MHLFFQFLLTIILCAYNTVVQRFTRQILAGLVALQEANIIHCDLKPENILLAPPKLQKKRSAIAPETASALTGDKNADSATTAVAPAEGGGGSGGGSSGSGLEAGSTNPSAASSSSRLGVWSDVKMIDFGSACFEGQTMYSYIQSRFCK